ncbi:DNA-directed DNA polymerase, partial [Tanacetum coccineum]
NQSDLESCKSLKNKFDDDSDLEKPIWRIDSVNTPYSVTQETARPDEVKSKHLYSASANEIDEKKPELKIFPHHLEYAYLHGDKSLPIIISSKLSKKEKNVTFAGFFQIPIAPEDQEKTTFTCPYVTFAYRRMPFGLCKAPATFQRCMTAIFHDMVEDFMEVFMDDFSVFGNSFNCYLANLDRMLARCIEAYKLGSASLNKKGAENLAIDHLSRLKNPDLGTFIEEEIADEFPNKHLMILKAEPNDNEPWYADYVNYIVGKIISPKWTPEKRRRVFSQVKNYLWDEPHAFRLCPNNVMRRYVAGNEILEILAHYHSRPTGGHHSASITGRKVYESGFFWPSILKDYVMRCDACQHSGNISSRSKMPQNNIQVSLYGVFQIMDTTYWSPDLAGKKSTMLVKYLRSGILAH